MGPRALRRPSSSWFWLIGGLTTVALITALTAPVSSAYPPLSSASPHSNGTLAAYRWLSQLGYRVRRSNGLPVGVLPPADSTIFVLQPGERMTVRQGDDLGRWVRRGGVAVVAAAQPPMQDGWLDFLGPFGISLSAIPSSPVRVIPTHLATHPPVEVGSPPATTLGVRAYTVFRGHHLQTIAMARGAGVVGRGRLGTGWVWLLTVPQALANSAIARSGDAALLLTLAGRQRHDVDFAAALGPSLTRPSGPAGGWLFGLPWGIALLFAVSVVIVYRWLSGLRLGPPVAARDQDYRPATEYVTALANLLRSTRGRRVALELFEAHFAEGRTRDEARISSPEATAQIEAARRADGSLTEREVIARCLELVERPRAVDQPR